MLVTTIIVIHQPADLLADYSKHFLECDLHETFDGVPVHEFTTCGEDPNALTLLKRHKSGVVEYISKLSLDLDGGWKACNDPGPTDQCPTTYTYEYWLTKPLGERVSNWQEAFVNSDTVPYIVIPYVRFHNDELIIDTTFSELTGVKVGDIGVVVKDNLVIPVLVADGGPHNKIGEGSLALFDELKQTRCAARLEEHPKFCRKVHNTSLEGSVRTIIFQNSSIEGLNAGNVNERVKRKAMFLYEQFLTAT